MLLNDYDGPTEVAALRHRLERVLDSTVAAALEHDHPADVVNDPQIRRLLISVRQQDGALADRAWWRIESAAAARLIELAELADEQTVAAASYLQQVAVEEEDGFEELPGGTVLFRCPADGCEFTIGITGAPASGDSDDDVQAVIDFHEQVFAHEALHEPRGELIESADDVPQQRDEHAAQWRCDEPGCGGVVSEVNDFEGFVASVAAHRYHAHGILTPAPVEMRWRATQALAREVEDDAQAAELARWASAPQAFRRARRRWALGLAVMVVGIVVGAFATPPADGRTVLALLLIAAGFVVSWGGARRMQRHAERTKA